jgi:HAD superfamily hydrolase (TIGR01509 family)
MASRATIDTIVCDVGDVVILFPPAKCADIERRHGLPEGVLLHATLKTPAARQATVGHISHKEWFEQASSIVGRQAVSDWLAYHGELNHSVVDMLAAARDNGIRLLLLSNATCRLWDDLDHHGLRGLAQRVFCSADIGYAKPDRSAYEFVAAAASLTPVRTLYIDDTPSWVEAGRKLGWHASVYRTPDKLRDELTALGACR